jgi:glutamate racemase
MRNKPIGIFDSGYGGLTILREIVAAMPDYDFLYLGDNARAPYGNRSFETVYEYTLESVQWFFSQGCELVILACNTASAKALRTIQQNDLPQIDPNKRVLGVIRPTSEVIGQFSSTGHVGVMGTVGTVQSGSYLLEIDKFFPKLKVTQEACPEWVDIVERNVFDTPEADELVMLHIDRIISVDDQIDTLLLACTHYPLLLPVIQKHIPEHMKVISQGPIIAEGLKDYLRRHPEMEARCGRSGRIRFVTTGNTDVFDSHASIFFGKNVVSETLKLAN